MFPSITSYFYGSSSDTTQKVGLAQNHISQVAAEKTGAEQVQEEMNRRNNLGYGLGIFIGRLLGTHQEDIGFFYRNLESIEINPPKASQKTTEPYLNYYQKLIPQDSLDVIYMELDPGVDDGAALLQLLAARKLGWDPNIEKEVNILGIIPCVGNAVISQTEKNTMQFLELTGNQDIKVYPGAIAPLAIEKDPIAIEKMNKGINATHFYGHDGESDVGGWPTVKMQMQSTPGYLFAASMISEAPPNHARTLVSTAALTELSKTLTELEKMDALKKLPEGSFAKNINVISIMGGCLSPAAGCNAPFNVTDDKKNSEANFYFDSPAARNVFAICRKYGIPIVLSPLDLTQQPGLLWTKEQVETLRNIINAVAQQMAMVSDVIPYLDAPCFPKDSYPMHDLFAALAILQPDLFEVTRIAVTIGNDGEVIQDPNAPDAEKNVYVLSVPIAKQSKLYNATLKEYKNFNIQGNQTPLIALITIIGSLILLGTGAALYYANKHQNGANDQQPLLPIKK
jgi:purine nucleosidase